MTTAIDAAQQPLPGRRFLLVGLGLPVLGAIGYVGQSLLQRLESPWYMPALGTLGVVLVVVSLTQKVTVWRVLGLLFVVLLAGAEWTFMIATRLPAYNGPITVGQPFPAFTTARAEGAVFTTADLQGDHDNVMVFFRGRW